ncbi:MAG: Trk system potassium transporter TrkA [Sphaerochaetaceae bacterium]|nr:Trk system potassium transporter TrkA [Sphaerochaetaceae bacterium]
MKVVILGAGRRGTLLARHLIQERKDVVIIESDPRRAAEAQTKLDCMVIIGSGTDKHILSEVSIESADAFVALSDSDEVNLVACGIVEAMSPNLTTIAAIRNLTYTGSDGLPETVLGIDYIVNPEAETARSIYDIIERGIFSDIITFNKTNLILYNIYINEKSKFAGKDVQTLRNMLKAEFVITAINRGDQGIVPSGNTVVFPGDTISLVASDEDIEIIFKVIGREKLKARKIAIVGGSKIARFLLRDFSPSKRKNIVLVEQDATVCETFASLFPEILVIKADITDETIFDDEKLDTFDLLIALTDNDELNIITASYAKRIGVDRAITLIKNNNNYIRLARHLDIDSVISVSQATVDSLLRYLRGTNVSSVHSLFGGRFEIFEFTITETTKNVGHQLKDINMRNKGIIAGITKATKESIVPTGNYRLEQGDVLLVAASRESLSAVQQLFE